MTAYCALLRAVNVGGTGKLAMSDLRTICEKAGYANVATYIQSGNVVFTSSAAAESVKKTLAAALERKLRKPVGVMVRTAQELARTLAKNPFPDAEPARVLVLFLDEAPAKEVVAKIVAPAGEQLALIGRELYIHYSNGMGKSKLKVPLAKVGTGRNLNTVAKLVGMVNALDA